MTRRIFRGCDEAGGKGRGHEEISSNNALRNLPGSLEAVTEQQVQTRRNCNLVLRFRLEVFECLQR
jgi:hypothetical protein